MRYFREGDEAPMPGEKARLARMHHWPQQTAHELSGSGPDQALGSGKLTQSGGDFRPFRSDLPNRRGQSFE